MATKKTRVKADKQERYLLLDRDYDVVYDDSNNNTFETKDAVVALANTLLDEGDTYPPYYIVKVVAVTKSTVVFEDISE